MRRRVPTRPHEVAASPTIAAIRGRADVDRLVERLRRDGSPLVERDPASGEGPDATVIATFCWVADGSDPFDWIMLNGNGITDRSSPDTSMLRRCGDTDLWTLSLRLPAQWRGSYSLLLGAGPFRPPADDDPDHRRWWTSLWDRGRADPFSRTPARVRYGPMSEAAMPAAPTQRWWSAPPGPPLAVHHDLLTLAGVERSVWTVVGDGATAAPHAARPRDLVIAFDGATWIHQMPVVPSLAALDASGLVPPFAVVFVDSVDPDVRARDLTCSAEFRHDLATVLAPWARDRFGATGDPRRTVIAGQSFGGLAAVDVVLEVPELAANALSQSGSFWWPDTDSADWEGWIWTERLGARDRSDLTMWVEAGLLEGDMHVLSRRFVSEARAAGAIVMHREFCGGHDTVQWRAGLIEGLVALLGRGNRVADAANR